MSNNDKIVCSNIWKLFGPDEKRILKFTGGKFSHINIGAGKDYSVNEIARIVKEISGFKGKIINYEITNKPLAKIADIINSEEQFKKKKILLTVDFNTLRF